MKNNSKIIVIGIIVVIIILSVGYALFSENINITGTATAEGSLDLEIVDGTDGGGDCWYCSDEIFSMEGTTITMSANLEKPEAKFSFLGYIQNNGSVDASLESITSTPTFNSNICTLYPEAAGDNPELCDTIPIYYDEDTGFYFSVMLMDSEENKINSPDIVIPAGYKGERYVISVEMGWIESWDKPITQSQNKSITTSLNFIQAQ